MSNPVEAGIPVQLPYRIREKADATGWEVQENGKAICDFRLYTLAETVYDLVCQSWLTGYNQGRLAILNKGE